MSDAPQKFRCIVADPPWPYHSPRAVVGVGGRGGEMHPEWLSRCSQVDVTSHYPVMSVEDLKRLPVAEITGHPAHLYLWTTNAFMVEAHAVAAAWGFRQKTIITWVKKRASGLPSMGAGYYYRGATEHCLFCVRGSLRLRGPEHPTVFETRRLPHSVKPDYFYRMVEEQSTGPFIDLFARVRRFGWHTWGNRVWNDVSLEGTAR